jgi:hypothetical protein
MCRIEECSKEDTHAAAGERHREAGREDEGSAQGCPAKERDDRGDAAYPAGVLALLGVGF